MVNIMNDVSDMERRVAELAVLYELRLMFAYSGKDSYTVDEITALIDKFAMAEEQ